MDSRLENIVLNIRVLRQYKKLTQDDMGKKMNISQNAYSKVEIQSTKITLHRLYQIAAILEVDIKFLIESGPEDMHAKI